MQKSSYLYAIALFFFSCHKLHDFIPGVPALQEPQFTKVYGEAVHDHVTALTRSSDKGYVLTGYTSFGKDEDDTSTASTYKAWAMKIDRNGNKLWQKILDDTGAGTPYAVADNPDGSFVIAGITVSPTVSGSHGPQGDAWVVKIDDAGNLLWQKAFGGSRLDMAYAITVADGGCVIAGLTESNDGDVAGTHTAEAGYTSQDAWLLKLDGSGNKQWQKALGGSGVDRAHAVITTKDGYVLAGYTESNDGDVTGFHGYEDVWVVKLDRAGNTKWQKALGGSNFEYATSVIESLDGGFVVAGYTASTDGDVTGNHGGIADAWIAKLDGFGNLQWQRTLGGSERDGAASVTVSADGGYVMAGTTESTDGDITNYHGGTSDAWIAKLDKQGNKQWQKTFGGSYDDEAKVILTRRDGSFVVAGISQSDDGDIGTNYGGFDVWLHTLK